MRAHRRRHPVRGGVPRRLRRDDRMVLGGPRRRDPSGRGRRDLRRRRRRHQRGPGRTLRRRHDRRRDRPEPVKLEMASKLGATHTATTVEEARELLWGRTHGQMADLAVITVGVLDPQTTVDAVGLIGKAGRVVVTSVSRADEKSISLTGSPMVGWHKRIQGSLTGARTHLRDAQPARPVSIRSPQARRDNHAQIHARAGQRGLSRPARGQEHPRRGLHES